MTRFGFAGPGPADYAADEAPDDADPRKPWDPPWRSRTAHRSCDPNAAAILKTYRQRRGWSVSEASRRSGVSRRMIGMLEHAQRRPSESTIRALINAYQITGQDAAEVWDIAIPLVGKDSPYRDGWRPGDPQPMTW
jgi:ribosome-binding protein aMBF1 (putative translation factor)